MAWPNGRVVVPNKRGVDGSGWTCVVLAYAGSSLPGSCGGEIYIHMYELAAATLLPTPRLGEPWVEPPPAGHRRTGRSGARNPLRPPPWER